MLYIPAQFVASIIAEAQASCPLEICGLMAGIDGEVKHVYPVENRLQSPYAYEMEPQQLLNGLLDISDRGWELLAIYHSHPHGPANPSPTDVAQAYYPEAAHVIISLEQMQKPTIGIFSIVDEVVQMIPWQKV